MTIGFTVFTAMAFAFLVKLAHEDYKELSVWPREVQFFAVLSLFSAFFLGFPTYPLVFAVGGTLFIMTALQLLPVADAVALTAVLYLIPSIKLAVAFILILAVVDIVYRFFFASGDIFISDAPLITESAVALAVALGGWLIWA